MNARAKAYEVEDDIEAVFDYTYQKGWTDGLPVVPATPARVERMLATVDRKPEEIIAHLAPARLDATVEKVAVCAVMAGCRPEYFPAVLASVEAAGDPAYELYGVNTTTNPTVPMIIMNGPARISLDVNCSWGVLGPNKRANATIGRALSLAMINLAGRIPEVACKGTWKNPGGFTMCAGEYEEESPYEPLHVERGFNAEDSVVTAFAMTSGPVQIVDQESRQPDQMGGTLGLGLESMFLSKIHRMHTDALLVVCPEHLATLTSEGPYSKARLRERIQAVTTRPLREMVANEISGAGITLAMAAKMTDAQLDTPVSKFASDAYIHIVVAGSDAGKFSAAFHGWVTGPMGSISVSRKIEC